MLYALSLLVGFLGVCSALTLPRSVGNHVRRDLIATHNFYRKRVGAANMRKLEWDTTLEMAARKRAATCRTSSPMGHAYGENVYRANRGEHRRGLVALALQKWVNEGYGYTQRAYVPGKTNPPRYTQLMWASSHRFGCAINTCYNMALLVCLYDPRGNVRGQYPYYLSGTVCGHCPHGTKCSKGLCTERFHTPRKFRFLEHREPTFVVNDQASPTFTEVCPNGEKWTCECRAAYYELRAASGQLTETEKRLLLDLHNAYRSRNNVTSLTWDIGLEDWAKYVIRCEPLYPGPSYTYTNFGKADANAPITTVVDDWMADAQRIKTNEPFCRTPADSSLCNRRLNILQVRIVGMACEAKSCNEKRQLTCIYKDPSWS